MERIRRLDSEVRTGRYCRTLVEQRPPCIGALDTFSADTVLSHIHVARGMHWLHQHDKPEVHETRNIRRSDDLRMFYSVTQRSSFELGEDLWRSKPHSLEACSVHIHLLTGRYET